MSVMFVDVRGYTSLAEQMEPAAVAARLNRFYEIATQAIFRHDGTLDKLVGDEVMAFFGAPLNWRDHPQRAVTAALEILRGVAALPVKDRLEIGIGISTGPAFVGNVGGQDFTDYTVLGDTVNVAARLQGAAAPSEILLAQDSFDPVARQFPEATRRELELKGKTEPVVAWEIARE
ncbi:MAG: adenylate/guanylate cyclase domain-containing protein [Candidatus Binatia bacterium]